MSDRSSYEDDRPLRSPPITEHIIIDALQGIRIVREGTLDASLNVNAALGSGSSYPIDPNVIQNHKRHRVQLQYGGYGAIHRPQTPEPSLSKFVVVKLRSWLVGYTRILSLHSSYFTTLDPDSFEITNKWSYRHIRSIAPSLEDIDCVLIEVVTDKGNTQLKLKCLPHDRTELLSKFFELRYYDDSSYILRSKSTLPYTNSLENTFFKECHRQTKCLNTRERISILCTAHGLIELEYDSLCPLKTYFYKNIHYVNFLSDDSNGIMIHFGSVVPSVCKLLFVTSSRKGGSGRSDLITVMKEKCTALGLSLIFKESSSLQEYWDHRLLSMASKNILGDSIRSFKVLKLSASRKNKGLCGDDCYVERYLSVTEKGFLVESDCEHVDSSIDPSPTRVVRCLNLRELRSIIRYRDVDPERPNYEPVGLEFIDGSSRFYVLNNRHSFLAWMCDSLTAFFPLYEKDFSCYRLSSKSNVIAEKICLKRLHEVCFSANVFIRVSSVSSLDDNAAMNPFDECLVVADACSYVIANFRLSIARSQNDETKVVTSVLQSLWAIVSRLIFYDYSKVSSPNDLRLDVQLIPILQTISLLLANSTMYSYMMGTSSDIASAVKQLFNLICDPVAAYWFLKIISSYSLPCDASCDVYKGVVLDSALHRLIDLIETVHSEEFPLMIVSSTIETLLHSQRLSTSINHLTSLTRYLSPRIVVKMLQSCTRLVVENAFIFLRIISMYSEHSQYEVRECLLSSGLPLRHFYLALFCPSESQRFFSRLLCSFCFSGPDNCHGKKLLKRLIPAGFLAYLTLPPLSALEEDELDKIDCEEFEHFADSASLNIFDFVFGVDILRLRTKLSYFMTDRYSATSLPQDNFRILFHTMRFDHELPDLIWNRETRNELRTSLERELINFNRHHIQDDVFVWNFSDFSVCYPSLLKNEVKVGSIYLRVFLQAGDSIAKSLSSPGILFEAIFRRFLFAWNGSDWEIVRLCIPCLNRLYRLHFATIGAVPEHVVIISRLIPIARLPYVNQGLLRLLGTFVNSEMDQNNLWSETFKENSEQLLNLDSFRILCEVIALAPMNLLDYGKVWHIAPLDKATPTSENTKRGPFLLSDLRNLVAINDKIGKYWVASVGFRDGNGQTYFVGSWDPVESIWELRMQHGADIDICAIKEMSLIALKILLHLLTVRNSVDGNGKIFAPIPIAKQLMNGSQENRLTSIGSTIEIGLGFEPLHPRYFLPIIYQCILCNDAQIVDEAAGILRVFLQYNYDGCYRFYHSGLFYIALISLERIRQLCPHVLVKIADILSYVSASIKTIFDDEVSKACSIVIRALSEFIDNGADFCNNEVRLAVSAIKLHLCKTENQGVSATSESLSIPPAEDLSTRVQQETIPLCPPSYEPPSPPNKPYAQNV